MTHSVVLKIKREDLWASLNFLHYYCCHLELKLSEQICLFYFMDERNCLIFTIKEQLQVRSQGCNEALVFAVH